MKLNNYFWAYCKFLNRSSKKTHSFTGIAEGILIKFWRIVFTEQLGLMKIFGLSNFRKRAVVTYQRLTKKCSDDINWWFALKLKHEKQKMACKIDLKVKLMRISKAKIKVWYCGAQRKKCSYILFNFMHQTIIFGVYLLLFLLLGSHLL